MLKTMTLFATTALALALPAMAVDPNNALNASKPVLDQLREESRAAKKTATDLAASLKSKKVDLSKAAEQITAVEKSHDAIQELLTRLESESSQWDAGRKESLEQARKVAEVMSVFVDNKKSIAGNGLEAAERERLRLNAIGVAQRAELLEKTLSRI
jgi:septal ring factor EnvC (AmiA/AmiB activator)